MMNICSSNDSSDCYEDDEVDESTSIQYSATLTRDSATLTQDSATLTRDSATLTRDWQVSVCIDHDYIITHVYIL